MRAPSKNLRYLLVVVIVCQSLAPSASHADHILGRFKRLVGETRYHGTPPCTGCDSAIECLAENIDWLEHQVDTYGSIVAKQPDIWGEARLTKHRDEYEQILFQELNQFQFRINASVSQADSAFLAQALTLSAAASTDSAPALPTLVDLNEKSKTAADPTVPDLGKFGADKINVEPTVHLDQLARYLQHLQELRRVNEGDDTSDSPGYSLNLVRVPISVLPGKLTQTGFGAEITLSAEPVLSDDLMPTTFQNLVVNDLVDQLGLPLVRLVENESDVSEAIRLQEAARLIEQTRDLIEYWLDKKKRVTPDVVQPLIANDMARRFLIEGLRQELTAAGFPLDQIEELPPQDSTGEGLTESKSVQLKEFKRSWQNSFGNASPFFSPSRADGLNSPGLLGDQGQGSIDEKSVRLSQLHSALGDLVEGLTIRSPDRVCEAINGVALITIKGDNGQRFIGSEFLDMVSSRVDSALTVIYTQSAQTASVVPSGRTRRAINPLNPSTAIPVLGLKDMFHASQYFQEAYFGRHIRWSGYKECRDQNECPQECRVNLLDARRWLQAELTAAAELMETLDHLPLLYAFANPQSGLADAIRSGRITLSDVRSIPRKPSVEGFRKAFFIALHSGELEAGTPRRAATNYNRFIYDQDQEENAVARNAQEALAWAVVVESALLNRRLNEDVRKVASSKECCDLRTGREYSFFLPESVLRPTTEVFGAAPETLTYPDAETANIEAEEARLAAARDEVLVQLREEYQLATDIFQRYVRCRWPIHVFALDPVGQDQNVAEAAARKRELQFALSLGFATGKIGGNSLTQFSRDLETKISTISLNRTAAGFSHGPDTFGWRFYPRVQPPYVPNTIGAIKETLCGTSREYDLSKRQLEAGMRECVAIVLMPSFVPYVDVHMRSNWFKLTNPKNAAFTMKDHVEMSRAITAMKTSQVACVKCEHLYRPGEVNRLLHRVNQLDRELPLQSMRVQAPYENTLGGFEMFNSGITDLGPELIGWHGAPGVVVSKCGEDGFGCGCFKDCKGGVRTTFSAESQKVEGKVTTIIKATPLPVCEGKGTSLFLVGDNFSVHDTRVIAGGVCIPSVQLISRQIMRVTIPSCVNVVEIDDKHYVEIHVATPYGVTNHLHVPAHCRGENLCDPENPCSEPTPAEPAQGASDDPSASGAGLTSQRFVSGQGHAAVAQPVAPSLVRLPPVRQVDQRARAAFQQPRANYGRPELVSYNRRRFEEELATPSSDPLPAPVEVSVVVNNIEEKKRKLWDPKDHPVMQQLKTKCSENMRNLRDKLPCY